MFVFYSSLTEHSFSHPLVTKYFYGAVKPKPVKMVLQVIKQTILTEILNLGGHQNCCIGSKVTVILLNVWILPIGGAASRMICACSLRRTLVILGVAKRYTRGFFLL